MNCASIKIHSINQSFSIKILNFRTYLSYKRLTYQQKKLSKKNVFMTLPLIVLYEKINLFIFATQIPKTIQMIKVEKK